MKMKNFSHTSHFKMTHYRTLITQYFRFYMKLIIYSVFFIQEPSADKDEDNCKRINEYLNNPSGSVPSASRVDSDLQSLLNNMSQSQLAQLFGGVGQMGGLHSLLGTVR